MERFLKHFPKEGFHFWFPKENNPNVNDILKTQRTFRKNSLRNGKVLYGTINSKLPLFLKNEDIRGSFWSHNANYAFTFKSGNFIGVLLKSVPGFHVEIRHVSSDESCNPGGVYLPRFHVFKCVFCYFCLCVIFLGCCACKVEKAQRRHRRWPNYPELFNLAEGLITTPWD